MRRAKKQVANSGFSKPVSIAEWPRLVVTKQKTCVSKYSAACSTFPLFFSLFSGKFVSKMPWLSCQVYPYLTICCRCHAKFLFKSSSGVVFLFSYEHVLAEDKYYLCAISFLELCKEIIP